jgi:hypothetical protein
LLFFYFVVLVLSCFAIFLSGSTALSQEYANLLYRALEEGKSGEVYTSVSETKKKELLDFRIKYKVSSEVHFGLLKRYGWSLEEYEV